MRGLVHRRYRIAATAGSLFATVVIATPALATTQGAPRPLAGTAATVEITGTDLIRVDRVASASVTFTGLDSATKARVTWGDGTRTESEWGTCAIVAARRAPADCAATLTHNFTTPGVFTITAGAGAKSATRAVTIVAAPVRWSPSAGQVFTSWAPFTGSGATFTPCVTVPWYLDVTGQPGDRATMSGDIVGGLSILAGYTGLNFVPTTDPAAAKLIFKWEDLTRFGYGPSVAGVGGPKGLSRGSVSFSPTNEWTNDFWSGAERKTKEWDEGGWHYRWSNNGRQALVVHEVMHAMGFAHVTDFTSIMYPQSISNGSGKLSAGDIDGLRTMYPSSPCPLLPD